MLSQRYRPETLRKILIPRTDWRPFPTADDRRPWERLPLSLRQAQVARGEAALDFAWPMLPATLYLDFARNGTRIRFKSQYDIRRNALCDLALAECIEGRGRFLDDIANGLWALCEESSWVVPAHIDQQGAGRDLPDTDEPVVDLFAAETSAQVAWIRYLLASGLDRVSPLIVPRIEREIRARILTPLLDRKDFWWMGYGSGQVNNWNPWIVSNWLASALLIEPDESRRLQHLAKAMETLDHFIDVYPADGGCDEGPGYWGRAGAALYDCLEWLHGATGGGIDLFDEPLVGEIGRFIYRTQIADRWFVNFADASPVQMPDPGVCYGYGKRIKDKNLQALGAWSARCGDVLRDGFKNGGTRGFGRQLAVLFRHPELLSARGAPPLPRDVFLDGIEVCVARDRAGSADGFFVAAKGGHNGESHNHNDVGHLVAYLDGKPVLVDAGVETYTAKTFSPERYRIWTMQSAYHSLPVVNGIQQASGREFSARDVSWEADGASARFSLDLAGAYPVGAGIRRWIRTVTLKRGNEVTINDCYSLDAKPESVVLNVLTACDPRTEGRGRLALKPVRLGGDRFSGDALLHYDAGQFDLDIEPIPIEDNQLHAVWGARLTRLVFRLRDPGSEGAWTLRLSRSHATGVGQKVAPDRDRHLFVPTAR